MYSCQFNSSSHISDGRFLLQQSLCWRRRHWSSANALYSGVLSTNFLLVNTCFQGLCLSVVRNKPIEAAFLKGVCRLWRTTVAGLACDILLLVSAQNQSDQSLYFYDSATVDINSSFFKTECYNQLINLKLWLTPTISSFMAWDISRT